MRSAGQAAIAATLGAGSCAALFVSQGDPIRTFVPALLLAAAGLLVTAPVRVPAAAMLLAALATDIPQERPSEGLFQSPLYPIGRALFENLHKMTGVSALRLSLADLLLIALLLVVASRRLRGRDQLPQEPPIASIAGAACGLAVAGTLLAWGYGLARGGDLRNSLWQVRPLLFAPLLAILFGAAFQGEGGRRTVARIVLSAAVVKALIGLWVYLVVARPGGMRPSYVTSHADSLLFSTAAAITLQLWLERRSRLSWALLLGLGPLLLAALYVNNRRLGWVCLAIQALVALLSTGARVARRRVLTLAVALSPLVLAYVAAGWAHPRGPFAPVRIVRSILDRKEDRSSLSRGIENYNLTRTMRGRPLLGTGFGHEYVERVHADSIRAIFPQYRYIPHNSLLGLFAFGGAIGGASMMLPFVAGIFLAVRARRASRTASQRVAAATAAGTLLGWLVMTWGDMALQSMECAFLYAAALAVASAAAQEAGAWPSSGSAAPHTATAALTEATA